MATRNYTIQFDSDIRKFVSDLQLLINMMNTFHASTRAAGNAVNNIPNLTPHVQPAANLADVFARLGGTAAALGVVHKTVEAIGEANKEAWEYAEKLAKEHAVLLDALRELASLKGKSGPTEADVKDVTRTMLVSGMTSAEATAFESSWANTIQPAIDSGAFTAFKPGQLEEAKRQLALFASRKGLKPGKLAEMALMATLGSPVQSPEELYARTQAISEMADVGLGSATTIEDAMKKNRGLIRAEGGGAFRSMEELGAATAAATTYGAPPRSAHSVEVVWRALTKPDVADKYGLHGKDFVDRLRVLRNILDAGRAQGKDDQEILAEAGIGTPQNAIAMVNMADRFELVEKWAARVGRGMTPEQQAAAIAGRAREFTSSNEEYLQSAAGQQRLAKAEREALEKGPLGAEQLAGETAIERATSRAIAGDHKEATRSAWDRINDYFNPEGRITGTDSYSRRMRRRAAMDMIREARRVGVKDLERFAPSEAITAKDPQFLEAWATDLAYDPGRFAAMAKVLAPEITQMGGHPFGTTAAVRAAIEGQPPGLSSGQAAPIKVESEGLKQAAGTLNAAGQALLEAAKQQRGGLPSFVHPYDADRK